MRKLIRKINWLFVATVVLPTGIAALYYGLIASDVYTSESRFVVRSAERPTTPGFGSLFRGVGFARAQDDAFAVQSFVLSREAVQTLEAELGVRARYGAQSIDVLSRFPSLGWDNSMEAFYRYYKSDVVDVKLDAASSILQLTTNAFTAQDAHAVNTKILTQAEALVNRLNERARQDTVQYAAAEVAKLETKSKAAAVALARFRNDQGVIDPERQSTIPLQSVARSQEELSALESQIAQIASVAPENPQLPLLRQRARSLAKEIASQSNKVAGAGERSLAGKASEFQRLSFEKEFADRLLAGAMTSLESARNEAQRQQLYLERIAHPSTPDEPQGPRRLRAVLSTLVLSLIAWGVLSMLAAGVREHHE